MVLCRSAVTPLCLLAQTSPPQGGRGALRQKESPFLLLAASDADTALLMERGWGLGGNDQATSLRPNDKQPQELP
ncbi:hypothetical protein ADZ37_07485 [Pannonibacter phragmitetus]|uniref:hypothetical protein n=1 Tax=Pannonibacter phragmitetus TaxID=121719 RepID=UPI00067C27F6|nr:hypothetical protein [Pannonibacter phragmitetus]KND20234.1 hypothetical protein ADZ37_07485 [Pannonibacter phragmitetus]